jgi:hypothetical protein
MSCLHQAFHKAFIDIEQTLVLAEIACVVAFVQHAPYIGSKLSVCGMTWNTMYRLLER